MNLNLFKKFEVQGQGFRQRHGAYSLLFQLVDLILN